MKPILIFNYLPIINRCLLPTQASQTERLVGLCPYLIVHKIGGGRFQLQKQFKTLSVSITYS